METDAGLLNGIKLLTQLENKPSPKKMKQFYYRWKNWSSYATFYIWRNFIKEIMMKKTFYNSPLGKMTILADDEALYGLWFNDQKHFGGRYDLNKIAYDSSKMADKTINWLDHYFNGQKPSLSDIVLAPQVTEFQKKVYQNLQNVPYGQTITYKELSDAIQNEQSKKNLSRAVGNAVGRNQILILIPCHRVIGSDGALTGYAGGLDRKEALLNLEEALTHD